VTIVAQPPVSSIPSLHEDDHEQVVIRQDPETGLRFIVAVHSTALGPSLGGMRLRRYPGGLREALEDVLALSRTMTLKAAAAGLDLGGGKSVMLDDGHGEMRARRMVAAAGVIDSLGGAYVTAEDIGTTMSDMDLMAKHTRFVVGRSPEHGGGGDPSPVTADTVFEAIGRGLLHATGSAELEGRRVGVIGVGKVGSALARRLVRAGARVVVCDIDAGRAERFAVEHGAELAPSAESVLGLELDVLSPCAAGGLIDEALARSVGCSVVAGAANNPLTGRPAARVLASRGILYVPDFLANCGGLIHVATEWYGDRGPAQADAIAHAMERLEAAIATADAEDLTPHEVAERQALERVERARPAA
jgi:glutamate dehydrogenase/leucine dehydrogenase